MILKGTDIFIIYITLIGTFRVKYDDLLIVRNIC